MKVNLHIKRLVLDGPPLTSSQLEGVQAAFEGRLAELVASGAFRPELLARGVTHAIDAGWPRIAADMQGSGLGQQIAEAVFEGIGTRNVASSRLVDGYTAAKAS